VTNDPYIVMVPSDPTLLAAMASTESETYLGLLIMTAFWAFFSVAVIAVIQHEASRSAAVGWIASFVAASLAAAFCFGMLQ
jgi:hypothetical protein